jgi:aspartate racemase
MERKIFGVLGGMGPQASAEFLKTVYEYSTGDQEQEFPTVMVYSDPTFPDRTDAFRRGDEECVLRPLIEGLEKLQMLGASEIVICCMTIHHLLPRLSINLRESVASMLDGIFDELETRPGKHLLMSSSGTRELQLFERHALWREFHECFVMPSDEDQERIHRDLIYPLKKNPDPRVGAPFIEEMLAKYGVDSFIAGCSEMHLFAKHFARVGGVGFVDPLMTFARAWANSSEISYATAQ